MLPAQVKVRVQARGGKILGPAAQQPLLSVRNLTYETPIIKAEFDHDSSGTVVQQFNDLVSRNAIVVQPPAISSTYPTPGPYWLETPVGKGERIVQIYLNQPSLLEFTATAFAPHPVTASATMWVLPEMQLLDDPGLVLSIAGLYTTVTATVAGSLVTVNAKVEMMCGCPITPQPPLPPPAPPPPQGTEMYWPSTEFDVRAELRPRDGRNNHPFKLDCTATSTFSGSADMQLGTYDVWVVAVQAKETNVGFASTTVKVT